MTDDTQLIAAIESEESQAYGLLTSELANQRSEAMDRYLGRPYGNEISGRSQIVSSDVADAVEWVLPSLLEIFISGDEIVKFDAKSIEDVQQAEQETDYVNNVVIERNQAFVTFNSWFKDALLQKNGYVKTWWHTTSDVMIENYQGLSQEELDYVLRDPDVEVIGQRAYADPAAPPMQNPALAQGMAQGGQIQPPGMLYDVKLKRKQPRSYVKFEPVPPEEILVSVKARTVSLQESPFVQHRTSKTLSQLRQMGYQVDDDIEDNVDLSTESLARDRFGEDREQNATDPAMREVTLRESWIRFDQDGDGVSELRRVCIVGTTILHNEECEEIPIAAITPIIMSHRHIGMSYYDLIQDLAKIKTTLLRGFLDNLYLQNNGRTAADSNNVNLEDLLVSRPGGIVRTDGPPSQYLMPLVTPDMSGPALQGISYIDEVKENRTGVTKYNQGLDAESLNKTASGINQIMNASQQRVKMIARCFAETGVRELFWLVHRLTLRHADKHKSETIKLRNKWVTVNPREWVDRHNLSVSVGLGTGNKDQQLMHLQMILQVQQQGVQFGLTDMSKIRNTLGKLTQAAGFKNAEEFWNDPGPQPPQPPPPPEVQVAQITAQAQKELTQMQSQIKHGADMQIAAANHEHEKAIEQMRMMMQQQAKDSENRTRLLIAEMAEETKRMIASQKVSLDMQAQTFQQPMGPQ